MTQEPFRLVKSVQSPKPSATASAEFLEWYAGARLPPDMSVEDALAAIKTMPMHTEDFRSYRDSLDRRIERAQHDQWREEDIFKGTVTPELEAVLELAREVRSASALLDRVAWVIELLDLTGQVNVMIAKEVIERFDEDRGVDVRIGEGDAEWEARYDLVVQEAKWVPWPDIELFVQGAKRRVMRFVAQVRPVVVGIEFGGYEDSPRDYS